MLYSKLCNVSLAESRQDALCYGFVMLQIVCVCVCVLLVFLCTQSCNIKRKCGWCMAKAHTLTHITARKHCHMRGHIKEERQIGALGGRGCLAERIADC